MYLLLLTMFPPGNIFFFSFCEYLYMHMHNFIAEIQELQVNVKATHKQWMASF